MSAVIMMTLFLAFKGVFIGTLILILNLTFLAVKFGSFLKTDHHHGWSDHHGHGWGPQKDVHLHIHNSQKPEYIPYIHSEPASVTNWNHGNYESQWNGGYAQHHAGRQFSNDFIVKTIDDGSANHRDSSTSYENRSSNSHPEISELEIAAAIIDKKSDGDVETNEVLSPYKYIRQSRHSREMKS